MKNFKQVFVIFAMSAINIMAYQNCGEMKGRGTPPTNQPQPINQQIPISKDQHDCHQIDKQYDFGKSHYNYRPLPHNPGQFGLFFGQGYIPLALADDVQIITDHIIVSQDRVFIDGHHVHNLLPGEQVIALEFPYFKLNKSKKIFAYDELLQVDYNTFQPLNNRLGLGFYSLDKYGVFRGNVMVHKGSFSPLDLGYYTDGENVFFDAVKIPGASPGNFKKIENIDFPLVRIGEVYFYKDKNLSHSLDLTGKPRPLPGADQNNHAWTDGTSFFMADSKVGPYANYKYLGRQWHTSGGLTYFDGSPVTVDLASLKIYSTFYAADSNSVFYHGKPVVSASSSTFSTVGDVLWQSGQMLATTKHLFFKGRVVERKSHSSEYKCLTADSVTDGTSLYSFGDSLISESALNQLNQATVRSVSTITSLSNYGKETFTVFDKTNLAIAKQGEPIILGSKGQLSFISGMWITDGSYLYNLSNDINAALKISPDQIKEKSNHLILTNKKVYPDTLQSYPVTSGARLRMLSKEYVVAGERAFRNQDLLEQTDGTTLELIATKNGDDFYRDIHSYFYDSQAIAPNNGQGYERLHSLFLKVGPQVFFRSIEKMNSISNDIEHFAYTYYNIGGNVYNINSGKIVSKDGSNFEVLPGGFRYWRDSTQVGSYDSILPGLDPNQVKVFDKNIIYSDTDVYYWNEPTGANPETISATYSVEGKKSASRFWTDGSKVFYMSQIIPGVDLESFRWTHRNYWGDRYQFGTKNVILESTPLATVQFSQNGILAFTGNGYYDYGTKVNEANPDGGFYVFEFPISSNQTSESLYWTDGTSIFNQKQILSGDPDPGAFQATGTNSGKVGNQCYYGWNTSTCNE